MNAGYELTEKEIKRLERKLAREYKKAEKEMRKKLEAHMRDFNAKDKVQLRLLAEKKITAESYERWRNAQLFRSSWMEGLVERLSAEQTAVNVRASEFINGTLPKIYAENHNYGVFEVERATGLNTEYTLFNKEAVERLARENPLLLPKAKVKIAKDKLWNQAKLRSALTQSLLQGESIPKMAKRLQEAGMKSFTIKDIKDKEMKTARQVGRELNKRNWDAAVRNARTMCTGAQNAGKLDSYFRAQDMGIGIKKMWEATHDSRTRMSHRDLDGEIVGLEEDFSNGLKYPGEPAGPPAEVYNCRCNLSMQLDGFERQGRDELFDLNAEHFDYEDYEAWKEDHR